MSKLLIPQKHYKHRHAYILISVLGIGIALNLAFMLLIVWPKSQDNDRLLLEQKSLETEYTALMKEPLPVRMNEQDMALLHKKVPQMLEQSRFMISLNAIEDKSGISISTLTSESGLKTEKTDSTNAVRDAATPFVEEKMVIHITGTYSEVDKFSGINHFIEQLYDLERITQINSLTYSAGSQLKDAGLEGQENLKENYEIDLNVSIFSIDR